MAKLKAPLLSFGASGAIAKAVVYFPWKGLNVAREYVIPANPKTTLQKKQRGHLTFAVTAIHAVQALATNPLDQADTMAYALWGSTYPTPRTWFNQLVKNIIDVRVDLLSGQIYRAGTTTPGTEKLDVSLCYSHGPDPTGGTFFYGTSKTALIHTEDADIDGGEIKTTLSPLTKGVKYYWQFRPTAPEGLIGNRSGIYYGVSN
ncbi:hypothetical protein ES708_31661 [subsurface metagenome]